MFTFVVGACDFYSAILVTLKETEKFFTDILRRHTRNTETFVCGIRNDLSDNGIVNNDLASFVFQTKAYVLPP